MLLFSFPRLNLLEKMKVKCNSDTSYNKVIDEFTKTEQSIEIKCYIKCFIISLVINNGHYGRLVFKVLIMGIYQVQWIKISSSESGILVAVPFLT